MIDQDLVRNDKLPFTCLVWLADALYCEEVSGSNRLLLSKFGYTFATTRLWVWSSIVVG